MPPTKLWHVVNSNQYADTTIEHVSKMIKNLVQQRNKGSGTIQVPVVIGPSGIGKTRFVQELCKEMVINSKTNKAIFARIRVNLANKSISAEQSLLGLLRSEIHGTSYDNLADFLVAIKAQSGVEIIFLSIDEYQLDLDLAQAYTTLCVKTIADPSFGASLIPIVSGVPKVYIKSRLSSTSTWNPEEFRLAPNEGLRDVLYRTLRFPVSENIFFDNLFQSCGGYPFLIDGLCATIENNAHLASCCSKNQFGLTEAETTWDHFFRHVEWRYGKYYWYSVFSTSRVTVSIPDKKPDKMRAFNRDSDYRKDEIVRKLLQLAITGIAVNIHERIIPDVAISYHEGALLYDLIPTGEPGFATVFFPLMAIYATNGQFDCLDLESIRGNPFRVHPLKKDSQILETLSLGYLAAILRCFPYGSTIPIQTMRPRAQFYCDNVDLNELNIVIPKDVLFLELKNHIGPKNLPLTTISETILDKLTNGMLVLAAADQPALDSLAVLTGRVGDEDVDICWLSQAKDARGHVASTDKPSQKKTQDHTVRGIISGSSKTKPSLRSIREHVLRCASMENSNRKTIFVYDIVTTHGRSKNQGDNPETETKKSYCLEENEVLFVITADEASSALGPVLGERYKFDVKRVKQS